MKLLLVIAALLTISGCDRNYGATFTLHRVHVVDCVTKFTRSPIVKDGSDLNGLRVLDSKGGYIEIAWWTVSRWESEYRPPCEFWSTSTWWDIDLMPHETGYVFMGAKSSPDPAAK